MRLRLCFTCQLQDYPQTKSANFSSKSLVVPALLLCVVVATKSPPQVAFDARIGEGTLLEVRSVPNDLKEQLEEQLENGTENQ